MGLKLRVAHAHKFPFFIVGVDQFEDISPRSKLTVVDGIVGEVLAHKASEEKLRQGFDPEEVGRTQEAFEQLDPESQHKLIQDWITGTEAVAAIRHNPIERKVWELMDFLSHPRFSWVTHEYPEPHEHPKDLFDVEGIARRFRESQSALYVGATVTVHTQGHGDIMKTVMLPYFKTPGFGAGVFLAHAIALLICLERLNGLMSSPQTS
jgi:hypothetical protein